MDAALFKAAAKGHVNEFPFRDIDKADMSIIFNKVSPSRNTMLHVAARCNHKDIIELMICYFPDLISKTNNKQDTALHVAARAGNLETVATIVYCAKRCPTSPLAGDPSLLLKMKNDKGNTALHDAFLSLLASKDCIESEKVLDLSALALHLASEEPEVLYFQNKEDLLKTTNEKKPEQLRSTDERGNNPLHCAASIGYIEGVRYLLEVNRDCIVERNEKGLYPLHVACKNGHVETTKELLTKWPDPTELLCNKGQNILHVAAKSGKMDVVSCIMEEDIVYKLINEMEKYGNTPLHLAAQLGHYFVVGILLSYKQTHSDLANNHGLTAYNIVAKQSEILEANLAGNHIISENEKDQQQVLKNIVGDKSSIAVGCLEKQPTKADSKKSKMPDAFRVAMMLSVFACRSAGHLKRHCISIENQRLKSEGVRNEEIKNRTNNLLVVATVIVGAAYAASVQMASAAGESGLDGIKEKLLMFFLFDSFAMNISIVASFLLCWAQLVAQNLASPIIWLVFGLLGAALYMAAAAFVVATDIAIIRNKVNSKTTEFAQNFFCVAQGVVFVSFLIVPIKAQEGLIMCLYYLGYCCQVGLKRIQITCFGRKQKN